MTRIWSIPESLFTSVLAVAFIALAFTVYLSLEHRHWGVEFEVGTVVTSPYGSLKVESLDVSPEPGELSDDEDLSLFYERQRNWSEILAAQEISIEQEGVISSLSRKKVSFIDLPPLFWIQIIVGLGSFIMAGWVWSLKSRELASRLFALSGLSTLMFTFSSAIYTTRELALPERFFKILVGLNVFGASLFGIVTLGLFLVYPLRFSNWRAIFVFQGLFFGVWTLLAIAHVLPASMGVNLITLTEMIGICIVLVGQFFMTKGDPVSRASLSWLGIAVLIGAGGFISLNALPLVLGDVATLSQGYAFLFFLAIYLGLAMGITRYRLFDVGNWGFRFLFYSLGAVLLVLMDAILIFFLGIERLPALGLSFFVVGLFYLPLRDWAQRHLKKGIKLKPHELIGEVIHVVLGSSVNERASRWKKMVQKIFQPLEAVITSHEGDSVEIEESGLVLYIPPVMDSFAIRLGYPDSGKSLFSKESEDLTKQLIELIEQAELSRASYEKGAKEERIRIAQDLHDDVGARLLNGLHSSDTDLRSTIREAIGDIRFIVSGISGQRIWFSHFLADLRHESSRRLSAVGISLYWPTLEDGKGAFYLDYRVYKALTSATREIVSNTIKHSSAKTFRADITTTQTFIKFTFSDDGCGMPQEALDEESGGNGLKILKRRVSELGGAFRIQRITPGTEITLDIPISQ